MMTELGDSIYGDCDLLPQTAQETVEGVAFSPDSGVSSGGDSEPSSPVLSRHFTQLTNAKIPPAYMLEKKGMSPDWHYQHTHQHQQHSPCGVYPPCAEDPQGLYLTGDDKPWGQDPTATALQLPASVVCEQTHQQGTVRREWVASKAGIQVCHTGDGNAEVRMNGSGLTYDIAMDIEIPSVLVKTEKSADTTSRLYDDNNHMYSEDMNNNNYNTNSTMFLQTYEDDNCNNCFLNRPPGYGHFPYQGAGHHNARAESPDVPTKKRHPVTRTERLWEFVLRLLGDRQYNPDLIEWADREDGMFRLNNSKSIAHMWGMRKNNVHMTYEKLSRALRYYYHRRILEPVLGKKLVYRFGPNATQVWANRVYRPQGSK
ncbi:hypothetical protein ACOMHN_038223 [Nucella lapillus]